METKGAQTRVLETHSGTLLSLSETLLRISAEWIRRGVDPKIIQTELSGVMKECKRQLPNWLEAVDTLSLQQCNDICDGYDAIQSRRNEAMVASQRARWGV